jgi:rhodanese-related sulfurtransferase
MENIRITAEEVSRRIDNGEKVFFADSRGQDSWENSDIKLPGALRVPADEAANYASEFPGDALIVTYCT